MKTCNFIWPAIVILAAITCPVKAQFTFNGQLIQRVEYRHGYGKLIEKKTDPAVFIGQRVRLEGMYKLKGVTFYTSFQDVRTWGNTAQLKITDNMFSLYEAWAEINFDSSFTLKVGRQELNYDNARFLGNVDWALQGRSHDFALLKYEKGKTSIHLGGGYNQDGEALTKNIFTINNQYKTAQFFRAEHKPGQFHLSFLFWNNGRQSLTKDTSGAITHKAVRFAQTIGLPTIKYQFRNTTISAFYYHQLGKDVNNKTLNAFDVSLQVAQDVILNKEKKSKIKFTAGAEALSGASDYGTNNRNLSFNPLFGTNHMHNGYMDFFYVAGRHENSVGLIDAFLKIRYDLSAAVFLSINANTFNSYAVVEDGGKSRNRYLGTELDFTAGYALKNHVSFQFGYSQIFASGTFKILNQTTAASANQGWAYLMIIVRPNSTKKFIGLYN